MCGIPWIGNTAIPGVFVGGAHCKLIHIGFAEHYRAGVTNALNHGRIVGCDEIVQHARATAGFNTIGAKKILVREWHAGKQTRVALRQQCIGGLGLAQREVLGNTDKAVECRVMLRDTLQVVARDFHTGKLTAGKTLADFSDRHRHYSITLGTRYRPSATSGAIC